MTCKLFALKSTTEVANFINSMHAKFERPLTTENASFLFDGLAIDVPVLEINAMRAVIMSPFGPDIYPLLSTLAQVRAALPTPFTMTDIEAFDGATLDSLSNAITVMIVMKYGVSFTTGDEIRTADVAFLTQTFKLNQFLLKDLLLQGDMYAGMCHILSLPAQALTHARGYLRIPDFFLNSLAQSYPMDRRPPAQLALARFHELIAAIPTTHQDFISDFGTLTQSDTAEIFLAGALAILGGAAATAIAAGTAMPKALETHFLEKSAA